MNNQAAKRYACDRCREHKLRCTRTQPGDSTCDRCLRIRAYCMTSSGRPLGRPSLQAPAGHVGSNRSSHHTRRVRKPLVQGPRLSTTPNPLPSPPSHSDPASTASASDSSRISTLFPHPPPNFDEMLNMRINESDFMNDTSSSAGYGLDTTTFQPPFCSDSTSVPELDFGNLGDIGGPKKSFHNPTGDFDDNSSRLSENSASNGLINGGSMSFLVSVIGSISHQLVDLKNRSWESWDPCLMRFGLFEGYDPDFTCSGRAGLDPCENTLWVTMRFALVLQTMVPAHFSTAMPPYSPPNLSVTLMLLSTYVQLGELVDTIFTRISTCLQEIQLSDPPPPTATRGSPPAHPTSLQIAMMIRVFEHQLHSVEHLMGLPSECRLWSRKDAYAGILDQEGSSMLTQAVMGQAQETFRSLKRTIEMIQISMQDSSLSLRNSTR